jgi:hypothetical protein
MAGGSMAGGSTISGGAGTLGSSGLGGDSELVGGVVPVGTGGPAGTTGGMGAAAVTYAESGQLWRAAPGLHAVGSAARAPWGLVSLEHDPWERSR